ncbi:hypothetical protein PIB30_076765, partial [Stylosanthes scabra]|nr:hypothetical protein [Stylosanthes scabra]
RRSLNRCRLSAVTQPPPISSRRRRPCSSAVAPSSPRKFQHSAPPYPSPRSPSSSSKKSSILRVRIPSPSLSLCLSRQWSSGSSQPKNDGFSWSSGDFPTLGFEKDKSSLNSWC